MDFRVLKNSENDLKAFKKLNEIFYEAFDKDDNYLLNSPSDEYIRSILDNSNVIHLVASLENNIVGGLVAYVLPKFEQERNEIYIYDLAVNEKHRRKKAATGLIQELKKYASTINAWVLYVQADHGDEPAIKLYESLGTREDVIHFDIMP